MKNKAVSSEIKTDNIEERLTEFRSQIDEIDEAIIDYLLKRTEIVKQVGKLKHEHETVYCPIRSGREAEMLRRITAKFAGSSFPAQAAASIWRIIIGASTSIEEKLVISVFSDQKDNGLYWLAREYFGSHIPLVKHSNIRRIIGDIMDGKSNIGVIPYPRNAENSDWWTALLQQGENSPKIFAYIPFIQNNSSEKEISPAFAVARLVPEPSSEDISVIVIEADHNVSQSRLQTALSKEGLEATWLNIATLKPTSRHHLVEIKGFITPEHEGFGAALSSMGRSIFTSHFLGAYAAPIKID